MSKPLYVTWTHMKDRCNNRNSDHYKDYGARGVKVCPEWQRSYETFYEWAISNGYEPGLTLDRIDNNGNYEPSNCRWADSFTQTRNKRNNCFLEYQGKTQTCADWAQEYGLSPCTLRKRLVLGWSLEDALTTPVDKRFSHDPQKNKRMVIA